ncbi:DUF3558 domain-containing protein [Amycolatopsis rhizosphaerae]|uniref:DUF3558 domain-containing protein n=1 Tax=Amycolatopsis rhizosphaerae TaxID=2053003 RepID=A0A558AW81_9PSEU|nr:DUF3558 domain-containing protein [Amycolatopsis rhizosphaerae]TVT28532.1 DUF3558 domain-containing protein [Amycolatopsis rhizosphaerae]
MSTSRAIRIAATMAATGLLTACSGGGGQSGTTTTSGAAAASSTSTSAASGGAPSLPSQLKVDDVKANPCNTLSSAQIDHLGMVGPGKQSQTNNGPTCTWQGAVYQANSTGIGVSTNGTGLDNIYKLNAQPGYFAYFEPTTINGYPAVYASRADQRSSGICSLSIGLANDTTAVVTSSLVTGQNKTNPCPVAERTAQAMIEHLKGAA